MIEIYRLESKWSSVSVNEGKRKLRDKNLKNKSIREKLDKKLNKADETVQMQLMCYENI